MWIWLFNLLVGTLFLIFYRKMRSGAQKAVKKFVTAPSSKDIQKAAAAVYTYEQKYHGSYGHANILRVTGKSEVAVRALSFEEIHDIHVTETPDQLVYTGATVGGVTTGGFHVEKGGISMSQGAGTGDWAVSYQFAKEFNGKPWSEVISFMQLTDQLFAEVKRDSCLRKLIVTDKTRKKWKNENHLDDLADVPCLIRVIGGVDEKTSNRLKEWLAGSAQSPQ